MLRCSSFPKISEIESVWKDRGQLWDLEPLFGNLHAADLFSDQKTLVDKPLKFNLRQIEKYFLCYLREATISPSPDAINNFFIQYFEDAGTDLEEGQLLGIAAEPVELTVALRNPDVKSWACFIHSTWFQLSRTVAPSVQKYPELHSLISLPFPIMIPGSRFREIYYWDSYWIIRGLLVSRVVKSAEDTVRNLLWLVEKFGFVPNGARKYYLNRSQPPLLSEMIFSLYQFTKCKKILVDSLPLLLKEHSFWNSGRHKVTIRGKNGELFLMNRYFANWDKPRPESYRQDVEAAAGLGPALQKQLYCEIASVAESGWDFSSRWMEDGLTMKSLRITSTVPVDLNAFLFQMERNIQNFASVLGDVTVSERFEKLANSRKRAMDSLLWNDSKNQWFDLLLPKTETPSTDPDFVFESVTQNESTYASNFIPLWCGLLEKDDPRVPRIVTSLITSGLIQEGGIATTLNRTGEQWDFPNAWAPLQHMIIEGLEKLGNPKASALAKDLASRFLSGVFLAFKQTGFMHEKYDCTEPGRVGGGGEYDPQVGFGWTNGVALSLLDTYHWENDGAQ